MRLRSLGAILSAFLLVTACASTGVRRPRPGAANAAVPVAIGEGRVVLGMTANQVRALWGRPNDIAVKKADGNVIVWTYERKKAMAGTAGSLGARAIVHRTICTLTFENGILMVFKEKAL